MKLKHTLIAGAVALLLGAPAFAADVLGTAGTVQVTDADITAMLHDAKVDPTTVTPEGLDRAVRNELARRVMLSEARKAGLDKQPDVQRAMTRASENVLAQQFVASQSMPPPDYPSDADLHAAYEANKTKFIQPKRVQLAQIFLIGVDDATQKRAAALAADLKAHPDTFADVASKQSQDKDSAPHGGNVGWVAVKVLDPQVTKAIEPLQKGAVSGPIVEKNGIRIVRVIDRAEEQQATFDQVRPDLTKALREQKGRENEEAYVNKMIAANPPSINPTGISRLAASQLPPVPK
jgi:parvulin-like peptidyl-prolyl isomerase